MKHGQKNIKSGIAVEIR